jgi:pimeloyl-ACP methyl ester carboxylesterase
MGGLSDAEPGARSHRRGMTTTTPTPTTARTRLLADLPVTERRIDAAGMSTAYLEGGRGAPIILLHGPGAYGGAWLRVLPQLVTDHRVIAPDLPGHGSTIATEPLSVERVSAWLHDLIAETCSSAAPLLVGHALGGAIAARYAAAHRDRIRRLVLVDAFGLAPFEPHPAFGQAIDAYLANPTVASHRELWRYCARDADTVRTAMGERWQPFEEYNLELVSAPGTKAGFMAMMGLYAFAPVPQPELRRIAVPTDLVWGRADLATPLAIAEAASARYGWPLHVIDDCADDPPIEAPDPLVRILRSMMDARTAASRASRTGT